MTGSWRPRLIPRKQLRGLRLEQVLDEYNIVQDPTEEPFDLENCGVHPLSGWELQTVPEGYRDKKVYTLYTTTPIRGLLEGSSLMYDKVEYPRDSGVWCIVLKLQDWAYGVQSHYKAVIVQENER